MIYSACPANPQSKRDIARWFAAAQSILQLWQSAKTAIINTKTPGNPKCTPE